MSASHGMIIAASIERYLEKRLQRFSSIKRALLIILTCCMAFLVKFSIYFEFDVVWYANCPNGSVFESVVMTQSPLI